MDVAPWFDFTDRVAIISGGAGAIGRELVLAFAQQGAHVVVADIDGAAAEAVARDAGTATPAPIDIRDAGAVERLIAVTWEQHGAIDVLVNAAAVYVRVPATEFTEDDYDHTMDVNVKGAWLMAQACGRRMVERGSGRIINYTSNAGTRGSALQLGYNASKAAIISITKTLAVEWAATGVTVNGVAPGPTDTPMMAPAFTDAATIAAFAQRIPQGRLTPADATVGPVLFLASPLAGAITGHTLFADGGMSAT
jgi:3-oxoacyl-[acyl-carrier protein] reductase